MKKAGFLLVLLGALAVSAPASASSPLDGWWPFYENAGTTVHDSSRDHNDGTLAGAVQWTAGYFGSGLSFAGGGATVPDDASLEPSSAVTVTAYVKASGSPGLFKAIIAKGASGCNAASYSLYTGVNGGLIFYVSQNGGLSYTLSPDAGQGIWDGNWHFVVGTYDGTAVRLYVDGQQVGNGTPLTGPIGYGLPDGSDLYIGHYDACGNQDLDFHGSIDEPTVWNTALNAQTVRSSFVALSLLHRLVSRLPSFPAS